MDFLDMGLLIEFEDIFSVWSVVIPVVNLVFEEIGTELRQHFAALGIVHNKYT